MEVSKKPSNTNAVLKNSFTHKYFVKSKKCGRRTQVRTKCMVFTFFYPQKPFFVNDINLNTGHDASEIICTQSRGSAPLVVREESRRIWGIYKIVGNRMMH